MIKILYLGNNSSVLTLLEKREIKVDILLNHSCIFFEKNYTIVLIDNNHYIDYIKTYPCLTHFKNIILLYDNNIQNNNYQSVLNSYTYEYFLNNFDLLIKLFTYDYKNNILDNVNYVYNYSHLENKLINKKILVNLHLYELGHYYTNYGYMFLKKILHEFINILSNYLDNNYEIYILGQSDYFITSKNKSKAELEEKIKQIINIFKLNTFNIDGIDMKYKFKIALSYDNNSLSLISKTLNNLNSTKDFYILNDDYKDNLFLEQQNNFHLAKLINKGFIEEKLITYYQPIKNNMNNKIVMYECLIRYKDSNLSPRDFMPVLQKSRLTSLVTYTIIKQSFKKLSGNNKIISINICEEDLENLKLINFIKKQQQIYGISSNRINFEILETFSINNDISVIQLKLLKDLGYNITLDNFGNNPSNFKILFDLNIDYLKINGYFISKLTDKKYFNIVNGILSLANSLNIKVIAEYVDNKEIQNIVKKMNINYSQGFYIGKPSEELK